MGKKYTFKEFSDEVEAAFKRQRPELSSKEDFLKISKDFRLLGATTLADALEDIANKKE